MRKLVRKGTYLFVLVAVLVLVPALNAELVPDSLVLTLDPTAYIVSPGQAFTINGTLTQSLADSLSMFAVTGELSLAPGDSATFGFDSAFSAFLLADSSSDRTLYSGPILDVTLLPSDKIGDTFSGFVDFSAFDGSGDMSLDTGDVPYTGTIVGSSVPEPSTLILLGTGLLGLLRASRRATSV